VTNSLLRIETLTSQPLRVKDAQLRVRSRVVQLRLPMVNGGLIWNRPAAVLVRTPDGQDQTLPVPDVTRSVVLALGLLCFASTLLLRLFRRKIA
jgi:hypothetical protein